MTRNILITIILFFSFTALAQKDSFSPPKYKKIGKAISKTNSPTFYPKLMERYQAHDTTLSPSEYHLLYYGYSLQPEYAPYAHQPYADSLMAILRKDIISPQQYDLVLKYGYSILEKSPFDMRYLDPMIYVYQMQGDNEMAGKLEFKLGRIFETIFTSGDGLTEKTAFHVVSVSHEYDLLRALGFGFGGQQSLTNGQCDFLKVEANEYGINGMYFNVSVLFKSMKQQY
jgi:hypothetical protein